ncbi:hypothetical protein KUTeg_006187 [Tegillarca granosa]|uniref:Hypoxia up-regulated protein 1 n=1 Tax=Tegillarca granosa TaxID=220873 RepID=A0ABQ9FFS1_TEGGR|nr:hypothetical protein KUTeg_006187 [Tegillarca granosa]
MSEFYLDFNYLCIRITVTDMMSSSERYKSLIMATAVLWCLFTVTAGFNLAVMSIDLGSEFMKVAIVKPGVPMEIVLNDESARKTSTIVAMRDGERYFGNMAESTAVKFPRKAFWYLTHLLGKSYEDPQVQQYMKRFPYYTIEKDEERGTPLFKTENGDLYSPEELLAMVLEKAKQHAESFADQPINDCVITVPVFYTQAERKAVLQAANMVGLNVLQLMGDNAAVALNYGVFRRKNFNATTQYYMFYDMGSTSTTATIVGYQVVKQKEGTRLESNPQLVIKGVGFDKSLGGLEMTLRLRKHLAKLFNEQKKTKTDVFTNERSMGKLFKEAGRLKKVLSANNDHFAQVEGLLDDKDFHAKVTREEFESMCEDLFSRVTKPIEDALKVSQITLSEINDVILMGGGTRVPKVQEILTKYLGRKELGKSINTDEAAALGAVYQAAHLGKGFKVKMFGVKEANIYPIVGDKSSATDKKGDGDTKKSEKDEDGKKKQKTDKTEQSSDSTSEDKSKKSKIPAEEESQKTEKTDKAKDDKTEEKKDQKTEGEKNATKEEEKKKWRDDMLKEQEKTPLTEKPKLLLEDIGLKYQALEREVNYLINKAKNYKPKPPKTSAKKNTTKESNDTKIPDPATEKEETKETEENKETGKDL